MSRTIQQLCKRGAIANSERGFILVTALLMLVVLSIMGTAAMTVRNTEVSIATNAEVIQHNFYALEAVTLEGTTRFEDESATFHDFLIELYKGEILATDPKWDNYKWFKPNDPSTIDLGKSSTWAGGQITPQDTALTTVSFSEPSDPKDPNRFSIAPVGYPNGSYINDRIQYAAVIGNMKSDTNQYEVCAGSDLSDPTKREACFSVFGMYNVDSGAGKSYSGRRMMMVGYKKTVYLDN
jgi:hypothetical protein